jgi:hypothetical protein
LRLFSRRRIPLTQGTYLAPITAKEDSNEKELKYLVSKHRVALHDSRRKTHRQTKGDEEGSKLKREGRSRWGVAQRAKSIVTPDLEAGEPYERVPCSSHREGNPQQGPRIRLADATDRDRGRIMSVVYLESGGSYCVEAREEEHGSKERGRSKLDALVCACIIKLTR